jgi:putative SOS response-associated peptidase YedK
MALKDLCKAAVIAHSGLLAVPMRWQFIPPWWKKSLKELPAASARALFEANAFSTSALLKEFNACQFSRLPQLTH